MTSKIDVTDIVSTVKDAVGESSDLWLNERISRLNLLINKNRTIVSDETAKYKLRYRRGWRRTPSWQNNKVIRSRPILPLPSRKGWMVSN